jgi:hypothetical protein
VKEQVRQRSRKSGLFKAKRQRTPWNVDEIENLTNGIDQFGVGNWATILKEFAFQPVIVVCDE